MIIVLVDFGMFWHCYYTAQSVSSFRMNVIYPTTGNVTPFTKLVLSSHKLVAQLADNPK